MVEKDRTKRYVGCTKAALVRQDDRLHAVAQAELHEHTSDMGLDRGHVVVYVGDHVNTH